MAWSWLLRDLFTTPDDDPITSPRSCEPTGDLTFVQTDGGQEIADEEHKFTAQDTPAWGDQGFYDENGQTRDSGLALFDTLNLSTWEECGIGWHTAAAVVDPDSMEHAIQANATDGRLDTERGTPIATGLSTSTDYELVQILRAVGCHYALDGQLVWVEEEPGQDTASVRPSFANLDGAGSNDDLGVVDLPDEGISEWDEDFSTLTGTLSSPGYGEDYDVDADNHNKWTHTTEDGKSVSIWYRGVHPDAFYTRLSSNTAFYLYKYTDGGRTTLGTDWGHDTDGRFYQVDVVVVGTSHKVYLDGVEMFDIVDADHTDHTGGEAQDDLDTNDLEVRAYPTPALGIADDRIICPQESDTATHSADCVFYARGVHLPSDGSLQYELRKSGGDEITLDIDSNGKPIIYENADARITGSNEDVADGDTVCVRLNDDTVDLFVEGAIIGSPHESLSLTAGTGFNMASIGTAGWTNSVDFFPQDVSALLSEGDGDVDVVQSPLGTLEITGFNPVVTVHVDATPGLGTLEITGFDPVLTIPVDVAATLGTLEITGYDPFVTVPVGVTAGLGTLEVTGFDPVVEANTDVIVGLGLLSIKGYNPVVSAFGGVGAFGFERIAIRTVHMVH